MRISPDVARIVAHLEAGDVKRAVSEPAAALAVHDDVIRSRLESSPVAAWPKLSPRAYHGIAGEIVRTIAPHTESDEAALLLQLLAALGSVIGRSPYFRVERDEHRVNLFVLLVGETSRARKGTSWGWNSRLLSAVDREWHRDRIGHGLSSGEGLVMAVHDSVERDGEIVDHGVTDKRLLLREGEFGRVLDVLGREGNTLSAHIRDAWDGLDLQVRTKIPARATAPHISIVGHVTREELQRKLSTTETANGFANRFLFACVRRSKRLPRGGSLTDNELGTFVGPLRNAVDFARRTSEVTRDEAAWSVWDRSCGVLDQTTVDALREAESILDPESVMAQLVERVVDLGSDAEVPDINRVLDQDADESPNSEDCLRHDPLRWTGHSDLDDDGVDQMGCGADCDDGDSATHPGAIDEPGDGVDRDCDGTDGTDADADGFFAGSLPGLDCRDDDPDVHPGQPDSVGNGDDENCDGVDGVDADADGHASPDSGGDDCNDAASDAFPGAPDTLGNAVDESCDGVDGLDGDRDEWASQESGGRDCDDSDPAIHPGSPGDWVRENVDSGWRTGFEPRTRIDAGDVIHVTYVADDEVTRERWLRYSTNSTGDWQSVALDRTDSRHGLALAEDASIHVIYQDSDQFPRHATNESGVWVTEGIDEERSGNCAIAARSASTVHVVFVVGSRLQHSTNTSGEWVSEEVSAAQVRADGITIVADGSGVIHVAYYDDTEQGQYAVYYATDSSGVWETVLVDSAAVSPSLALGTDGSVHLAYASGVDVRTIRYATLAAGEWTSEPIGASGSYPVLALDEAGQPHVTFIRDNAEAVYATRLGGVWPLEDVEVIGSRGLSWRAEVVVDTALFPHVIYTNAVEEDGGADYVLDLRHAERGVPDGVDDDCDGVAW